MVLDPIAEAWHQAWSPPDRRELQEWAREVNLQGDYARTGWFSCENDRFLIFPFQLLGNDVTRMINLLKAPRTGGSLVGDIFLQSRLKNYPGPTMMTFQSDDDAEQHFLTRIEPTLKATPANAAALETLKKKRDLYQFAAMNLYVQGANRNSLQRKSVKWEWNDEVWLWKPGFMQQAWNRTEDHKRTCKILNVSQAGDCKTEWETTFNSARRYSWGVRCQACAYLQPYDFFAYMLDQPQTPENRAGIVWDRSARLPDGRWNISRAAETARFKCIRCGHEHPDDMRSYEAFNASGDYLLFPGDEDRSMVEVSLRWTALVGGDWWRLVKRFLSACEVRDAGSTVPLEEFYRGPCSLFWDPSLAQTKTALRTGEYLMETPLSHGYTPQLLDWERLRVITADYQQGSGNDTRHLIVTCRAWGALGSHRSRLLWQGRVNSFEELHNLQRLLGVKPACVGIDGSFEMMEVAAQCAKYGWTVLIGDDPKFFSWPQKKGPPARKPYSRIFEIDPGKGKASQGRAVAKAMRWSNPSIKNVLWNLRHGLTKHQWELPADLGADYRDGIDSELKKLTYPKGSPVPVWVWEKIKANNHPWDCECMQTVIAIAAGFLSVDVEDEAPPPPAKTPPPGDPASPRSPANNPAATPSAPHAQPEQLSLLPT